MALATRFRFHRHAGRFARTVTELIGSAGPGWTEFAGSHAASDNTRTFIAGNGGNPAPNDMLIWAYVHATDTLEGPVLLSDNLTPADSSPDSHNQTVIAIRPDGHIVVAYCGHQANSVFVKISNDPNDIVAGFSAPITISSVGVGTATYPQIAYLTANDRIYLHWRWTAGGVSGLAQSHSDDGGATWSAAIQLYEGPGALIYSAFGTNGVDRIDLALTDYASDHVGGFGLWHFYIDETGARFKTDGTSIGASLPLATSDMTEIVAAGGDTYPYSLGFDGTNPVIAVQSKNANPVEIGEERWSGAAWVYTQIDTSDPIPPSILSVGGGCHDPNDASRFFSGKVVSGIQVMFFYTRTGGVWSGVQIPNAGAAANSPVYVYPRGPVGAIWFGSGFTGSDDFSTTIIGFG